MLAARSAIAQEVGSLRRALAILTAAVILALGTSAWSRVSDTPQGDETGSLGTILAGANGMTVYTFVSDKDDGRVSARARVRESGPHPVTAAASAPAPKAPLGVIARDDGSKQYAWKGETSLLLLQDKSPATPRATRSGEAGSSCGLTDTGAPGRAAAPRARRAAVRPGRSQIPDLLLHLGEGERDLGALAGNSRSPNSPPWARTRCDDGQAGPRHFNSRDRALSTR